MELFSFSKFYFNGKQEKDLEEERRGAGRNAEAGRGKEACDGALRTTTREHGEAHHREHVGHLSPGALGCRAHHWEHLGTHQRDCISTEQFLPLKEKRNNWKPTLRQEKEPPFHGGTAPNRA